VSIIGDIGNDLKSDMYDVQVAAEEILAQKEQATPQVNIIDLKRKLGAARLSYQLYGDIDNAATVAKLNTGQNISRLTGSLEVVTE